ncbi:hypothetical protein [Clostridium baratii]|uniref:hypothetical protein n=1 Tax=Clostridium baratii TaxID=1561 RepID=UPI0005F2C1E3|nr:hypothetical protein [Clostridium baratii]KJU72383.1 hypothetical protein UC77_04425 [Clostridium baratii]
MDLNKYGIKKTTYKTYFQGSVNKIIEYRSETPIFISVTDNYGYNVIKIYDIENEEFLKENNIEYIKDDKKIIPTGLINKNGSSKNIKFFLVNDNKI